ncbi:DUF2332 domain-containing protein [soil metagenome]
MEPVSTGSLQAADADRLVGRLHDQSRSAALLGSPLYADLLTLAATDVDRRGPCWRAMAPHAHEPDSAALPLRFMAAIHRLVLRRQAPALALHYPSVGGGAGVEGAGPAFLAAVEQHVDALVGLTGLPCQTNEVGRSAALAPALLWVQAHHDLPLHQLEIGTSAGLNLRWDHFCYGTADGRVTWGDPASPVDLVGHWIVPPTALPSRAELVARRGCDPAPGDPADAGTRETLTASVWADQHDRHQRLRGALALAADVPAQLDAEPAGTWLARQLDLRPSGAVTVVTHSVVWRYLGAAEQKQVLDLLDVHGRDATPDRPLAWVRLEPAPPLQVYDGTPYPVTVTTLPGGTTRVLAHAQAHGQDLRWVSAPARRGDG